MNILGSLLGTGLGKVLKPIKGLVTSIWGDAKQRERFGHSETMAVYEQFASEFRRLENRTAWDSFVDGLNRLPRPVMVAGTLGYFALAYADPQEFQVVNTALEGVPEPAWYLLSAIVGFFFGARELHKQRTKGLTISKAEFAAQQARVRALRGQEGGEDPQTDNAAPAPPERPDDAMTDEEIAEWNEANNPTYDKGK